MKVFENKEDLKKYLQSQTSKTIGFVPTMGYLHEGHLSLVKESKAYTDLTVVSIFVNPAQFNDPSDLEKYPRNEKRDLELLHTVNADVVYLPTVEDLYGKEIPKIQIQLPHLTNTLCGRTRPGHFEGVMLVIGRLFHIVSPNICYLGKKDYQQCRVIQEFAQALAFPTETRFVETVREPSGLAMSSRNSRLSEQGKEDALVISKTLKLGEELFHKGERDANALQEKLRDFFSKSKLTLDYLEIVSTKTLQPLKVLNEPFLVAIAGFAEGVRLIDNKEISL